ncbi:hypothetical protein H634G_10503 [Metarhizium anisopliae BRIP 53293]|uniref:Heterokaryon incompatibility domain-containing protein n=1 Tax=Metarhizium anisopliae BRIP 53293 TaxID=1291518 RepID=A0A0D9NJB0_METAN|nr:hypothetical protein H634G_10503 [Metarhizium anisopliae BRIP 53293]KJK87169.1 hypothetical protein H633G_08972 [Metarhizium anisopliae BRIP 53284]
MQKDTEQTKYVALTHRWASQPTATLTSRNVDHLQRKITLEELPRTFQDAVQFTRSLGMRYLWIDSLCIQQDCQDDWRKESAVMGKVYGHSFCNIAATAAANGEEGLFVDRDILSHAPFKIDLRWRGHQRTYYCLYSDLWHLGVTSTPLNHRGWVLQERLLSPRTLSFDNTQLFWECRQLQASESFPKGLGPDADFAHEDIDEDSELCSKAWATEVTKPGAQYAPWRKVIEQFMVCNITKATDKLIAVSGIAQEMQSLLGDTYVAGLWERNLTLDLLWYVERWPYSFRGTSYRG